MKSDSVAVMESVEQAAHWTTCLIPSSFIFAFKGGVEGWAQGLA